MPKTIELTVEIDIQRVSCPGVWLCQDGRVSLTVYALGTSYQTCLLPPVFPLAFKDVFYFRKRFQESCALNNICCLLKDESIYCELLQWCEGNGSCECEILAQYLGALNNVLFPPNMCSSDGVDLLMRRSKNFPGILSPKIEIATKVRIDEVWNPQCKVDPAPKVSDCYCPPQTLEDLQRKLQQQACHTARYHRNKCNKRRTPSATRSRSRSRSRSESSKSCSNLSPKANHNSNCSCLKQKLCAPPPRCKPPCRPVRLCREFCVYNVQMPLKASEYSSQYSSQFTEIDSRSLDNSDELYPSRLDDTSTAKTVIESRFIDHDRGTNTGTKKTGKRILPKISPCICEICKRYHELFHFKTSSG